MEIKRASQLLLQRGIRITTIYSNGKLVTDKLLDELEQRGIYPEFNMSFDGVGHHDWLRGIPGAEEAVKEAFVRCRKRGFPTAAEMCIHEDNKHTLRESVNRMLLPVALAAVVLWQYPRF